LRRTDQPSGRLWRPRWTGRKAAGVDEPPAGAAGRAGFRSYGKSKDSRDDLPQVVVGMAVTRDGIPVRVWCWPGNTSDSPLIRQVTDELRDWTLGKVIWVADRGFTSAANRRHLAAGADGYLLGEKLRSGSAEAIAAMARQGRYQDVTTNLGSRKSRSASRSGSWSATTPTSPTTTPRFGRASSTASKR
jgi:Transposase DDE domain